MKAHKLQVKLFADGPIPALEAFIPVFHRWIKHHVLPELLVDVANYAHVPKGPGVALIGHGSDYYIDSAEGRPGLLYSRKREAPAEGERLTDAFRRLLHAAVLLEQDSDLNGKIRFRTDEFQFRVNDRLAAPSAETTFAELRPELDAFCTKLFGAGAYQLCLAGNARTLFTVKVTTTAKTPLLALRDKLGAPT